MKKVALMVMAILALSAFASIGAFAADNSQTVTLNAQNGSGENGTAVISAMGSNDITVSIKLGNTASEPQPAHIHKGTCAKLDPNPLYPLTNVVNGKSETEVMVSMADLEKGEYAINVHKSATDIGTYVSCGDLKSMMMSGGSMAGGTSGSMAGGSKSGGSMSGGNSSMPGTGSGDQPLFLALLGVFALALTGVGLKLARSNNR